MPRIGLCLSGGAARGIAHLGVLKALQELGIEISIISGVSSGAIASAFVAAGYTPDEVLQLIKDLPLPRLFRPALNKGILRSQSLQKIFQEHLGDKTFEELPVKLIISAADLIQGTTTYFREGSLVDALLASSSVPILYQPFAHNGKLLVDGGLINNLPVECLTGGECDKIIGVHVNPLSHKENIRTIRQVSERIFHLAINANAQHRVGLCDFYLEPPRLKEFHIYAIGKAQEIFDVGYEYAHSLGKELQELKL